MKPCFVSDFSKINIFFDTYFLDMYGVLWDGTAFYPGVLQTLRNLREQGKKTVIISNMTTVHDIFCESKAKSGLIKGVHFDAVVTSGDICKEALQNGLFNQLAKKDNARFFVVGEANAALFQEIHSLETNEINHADVIYLSGCGEHKPIDFYPLLNQALKRHLPAVCANPDIFFMQNKKKLPAQGTLAAYYKKRGGQVVFFGKPYPLIFEKALQRLNACEERTLMIGDMLETDILGASNAGLKSLLILNTGIMGDCLKNKETLDNILNGVKIYPDFTKAFFADN